MYPARQNNELKSEVEKLKAKLSKAHYELGRQKYLVASRNDEIHELRWLVVKYGKSGAATSEDLDKLANKYNKEMREHKAWDHF